MMAETDPMDDVTSPGPLAGLRVIELALWVAGPAAAGLCADWGADVIKVEPPAGDPQRDIFGALGVRAQADVPPFEVDNRGKRSVVVDVAGERGRAQLDGLLETADVFVTNLRPAALARLGLGHEEVLARHPRLVYASVTGYGLEGPDADRPGYDIGAFYARSGVAHTLVPDGEYPPALRSGFGDHFTGVTLVAGITARLLERERTGRGGFVTTSLLRTGMYGLAWDISLQLRFGKRERTRPRDENGVPLVLCYRAGDGRGFWLVCLEGDRHWPKLLTALDRHDLADDDRFATAAQRRRNAAALIATLDAEFAGVDLDVLARRFDDHDVWWAPINSIAEVVVDPQARAAGAFVTVDGARGAAPFEAVNGPVDFAGYTVRPGPVPALGEHTDEVLGGGLDGIVGEWDSGT
jgi:crotonobetainyl-CoA:carnitine CoA-transferase CaiB-like acyl-CoA transferase